MRPYLVLLCALTVAGCSTEKKSDRPVVDDASAQRAVRDVAGADFESKRYDVYRELSPEERKLMEKELGREDLKIGDHVYATNSPPDRVVEEVRKLRPGRSLSFCDTWHTEKKSGDVIEMKTEKPRHPVGFGVISRGEDGKLHASRLEAMSHEEALSRR